MEIVEPNEGVLPRYGDGGEVKDVDEEVRICVGAKLFAVFGVVMSGDIAGGGEALGWSVAGRKGADD
jgi:hypothetical protein